MCPAMASQKCLPLSRPRRIAEPPRQTGWVMVDGEVLAWFGDGRKFILTAVVELAALFALARREKDCWLTLRCLGRQ